MAANRRNKRRAVLPDKSALVARVATKYRGPCHNPSLTPLTPQRPPAQPACHTAPSAPGVPHSPLADHLADHRPGPRPTDPHPPSRPRQSPGSAKNTSLSVLVRRRQRQALAIARQSAEACHPGKTAFHDSAAGQQAEAPFGRRQLNNLGSNAVLFSGSGRFIAGVTLVHEGHLGPILLVGRRHQVIYAKRRRATLEAP